MAGEDGPTAIVRICNKVKSPTYKSDTWGTQHPTS